ncbi:ankyrin repeat and LEM domain-containing protein 1 [Phalacrocorax aristotelis]|uniref:ankyrin repeat and LEM domain-containing protein 1 n=1 Tax=Phalacrocorax aristotelis TaxID=126867 RepID=UPI003F4C9B19
MSGAGRCEPCAEKLTPLHVTASRGCRRCLKLLLKKRGDPELQEQDGKRAADLALVQGNSMCVQTLQNSQYARGWPPVEDPGGPRWSLSFLTEDGTEGSLFCGLPEGSSEAGPLSSTRRSLLEELELGGGCDLGEPPFWPEGPPEPPSLGIPSLAPWAHADPGGPALPLQPLASSTLLSAGDELREGHQSQAVGARMGVPCWALLQPSAADSPGPSPQWGLGPGGSLSSPGPQCCSRVPGGHGASPRAPQLRGGLSSCSVAWQSPGDGDIPGAVAQHRPGVPWGPAVGWAGLGIPSSAALDLGTMVLEARAGSSDRSSLGDSSGASECFITAVETLEPSETRGCLGALHCRSPQPRSAGGLEPGKAHSPAGAAAWELPLASSPNAECMQGEDFQGGSRAAPYCDDDSEVGSVGELLARLQGCSLRDSPPCSLASLAAGDAASQGLEPPWDRHVTPRTKSRLQASAARLNASSSSSLFDKTLEVPRRPPRLRAPRGVPRDPATTLGHCVTPQGDDVSSRGGEGTGSLDDTEIIPRAPSQPSSLLGTSRSPGSSPTVLLVPGDHRHFQDSPSAARGSPGSSPTVLLVPGDHGHPQDSSSEARGSPGSSPTALLVPGDHRHLQDSTSEAWGSHCATSSPSPRVLEDRSGWQDPSSLPLGTHQPPWPHGSVSHLLAPQLPASTAVEPGSPAVPLLPAGCSARCSEEHLEDEEQGQAPTEQHSPGTEATSSPEDTVVQDGRACTALPRPLSDEGLRRRLRALGDDPGPVTELTRRLYLRRLEELVRGPQGRLAGHSPELVAVLRTGRVPDCTQDELALARQFDRPDQSRHWREGLVKSSFNYLLLDPRTTQNLPLRSHHLSPVECFRTFIKAIFYVGKGTRARPYCHLAEALSQHRAGTQKGCPKVQRILEIWASGQGVVSVHCFQSTVPAEAYTREGCLVEALGLRTLTNQRKGNCYGVVASWPAERRRRLGVHMLHRAMRIFLAEGERQLRPADIQGGR